MYDEPNAMQLQNALDEVQRCYAELREFDRVAKQEFRYLTKVKKERDRYFKHAEEATKIGIEGRRLGIIAGVEKAIKIIEDSSLSYGETFRVIKLLKEELE